MDTGRSEGLLSGTVTFVFTDIEGSTKILDAIGIERFERVLEDHTTLLRSSFVPQGGREIRSEGDSFFYVFPLAASAVTAAAAAQRAFAAHSWPADAELRLRIGMHTGQARPASAATGVDYVGPDVHRASRIAGAGHGGQTLVSEATRILASGVPAEVTFRDLGEHRFKGLDRPERVYEIDIAGLSTAFPPINSLDRPALLPVQRTSFVGRETETARARELLRATRLLTLTGPGGTGKTRLALELAAASTDEFAGDVHFVPLAAIAEASHVPGAVARSLAVVVRAQDRALDVLLERLRTRRALLVLDNFEHVLDAAPIVGDLLGECPTVKVIATSRARLDVSGEQELPIPPLRVPEADRSVPALERCESVRLFVERASSIRPDFRLDDENAAAIAEICERLDGLPLALELAAARIDVLPPHEIAERLERHLSLPGPGPRDLPERQRTLDAAIGWSYALLDPPAQRLFGRFSVFAGGARLEEVERVCSEPNADTLDILALIVRQNLARQQRVEGHARFVMFATIRDFASKRLNEMADAEATRGRHAAAYADLFESAKPALFGRDAATWLARLDREQNNLRSALAWAATSTYPTIGLRLVAASWRYWQMSGGQAEGRRYAEEAVARGGAVDPVARIRGLEALAGLAYWQFDAAAIGLYEERLRLARASGDLRLVADATYDLAFTHGLFEPDSDRGIPLFREAVDAYERLGDAAALARARVGLATGLQWRGDGDAALAEVGRAIPTLRASAEAFTLGLALSVILRESVIRGDLAQARSVLAEVFEVDLANANRTGLAVMLGAAALIAHISGDRARALRLAGAATAMREQAGIRRIPMAVLGRDFALAGWDVNVIHDGPSDTNDRDLWEEGRHLPVELAIAEATRDASPSSSIGATRSS